MGAFIILTDGEREEAARFLERNTGADAVRRNGIKTNGIGHKGR
jgi:hypothetical protein